MKRSLSDFSNVNLNENKSQKMTQDDVIKEYDKIKNLSQDEAKSQLMNEVFKQKQNGTFNFQNLSAQVDGLKGYLPEKDYQNLKRMLESLR